jgi:hypothetical protein
MIVDLLKTLGIKQYDPRVVDCLLDLTYKAASDILSDAEAINLAAGGNGTSLTPQDIALAAAQHARLQPQPPSMRVCRLWLWLLSGGRRCCCNVVAAVVRVGSAARASPCCSSLAACHRCMHLRRTLTHHKYVMCGCRLGCCLPASPLQELHALARNVPPVAAVTADRMPMTF